MSGNFTWFRGIDDADLKKLLKEGAKQNPAAASSERLFLRPPFTNPVIYQPPDCGKQQFVWIPDIAVKLITTGDCPSDADLASLKQVLGGSLSGFNLPSPDVRVKCQNQTIFISIWGTGVQPNSCSDLSRQRAQDLFGDPDPQKDKLHDISNGGNFGIYIGAGLIQRLAKQAFDASPKTFDENGQPSDAGPIHLTGLSVGFPSPTDVTNQTNHFITTMVSGYEDLSWPSVSFVTTLTDQLMVTNGRPDGTTESNTQADTGDILAVVFTDLFVAALSIVIPGLFGLDAFLLAGDIGAALIPSNPNNGGGVGLGLYEALPLEIPFPLPRPTILETPRTTLPVSEGLLPQRMKLQLTYLYVWADNRGLLTSATATKVVRTPGAEIVGPDSLVIDLNASSTFGNFSVEPHDFFGNLTFSWSGGMVASANAATTRISFSRGTAQPGETFNQTITVQVADVEGSRVTVSLTVSISVSTIHIPPFCISKPWLKQCQAIE